MEKKPPMCLSREEQDSMRALAGTAEETVELSNTLYQAVVIHETPIPVTESLEVAHSSEESPTRRALKTAPIPIFPGDSSIPPPKGGDSSVPPKSS
jgi:hypothetical protein